MLKVKQRGQRAAFPSLPARDNVGGCLGSHRRSSRPRRQSCFQQGLLRRAGRSSIVSKGRGGETEQASSSRLMAARLAKVRSSSSIPERKPSSSFYDSPTSDELDNPDNITCHAARRTSSVRRCGPATTSPLVRRLIGLTLDGHTFTFAQNNINLTAAQISAAGKSVTPGSYTGQEWAGAHFSPDGQWLFVNIQTPGITFAITGPWDKGLRRLERLERLEGQEGWRGRGLEGRDLPALPAATLHNAAAWRFPLCSKKRLEAWQVHVTASSRRSRTFRDRPEIPPACREPHCRRNRSSRRRIGLMMAGELTRPDWQLPPKVVPRSC